jgi:catechol 2,3-dioxygenase-like lactoylglutathione lyase family enzyme
MKLCGLDHADIRVPSLAAVERFYDAFLPAVGLSRKTESHVGADGEWHAVDADRPRNVIEFATPVELGSRGWFVGFIEVPDCVPALTRIAFGLESEADLPRVEAIVREAGGRVIEWSADPAYPAIFFEDPAGTRLEVCARRRAI